jgi:hypothetical protein
MSETRHLRGTVGVRVAWGVIDIGMKQSMWLNANRPGGGSSKGKTGKGKGQGKENYRGNVIALPKPPRMKGVLLQPSPDMLVLPGRGR